MSHGPNPEEEKLGYHIQSVTYLGAIETYVLVSHLWLVFCK